MALPDSPRSFCAGRDRDLGCIQHGVRWKGQWACKRCQSRIGPTVLNRRSWSRVSIAAVGMSGSVNASLPKRRAVEAEPAVRLETGHPNSRISAAESSRPGGARDSGGEAMRATIEVRQGGYGGCRYRDHASARLDCLRLNERQDSKMSRGPFAAKASSPKADLRPIVVSCKRRCVFAPCCRTGIACVYCRICGGPGPKAAIERSFISR